ncbi:MAG: acetyl-CoA hydrolase/transferase C-terminal domain-containing protein [Propionibacteriaceae bacterium]|nr:acetyl-CoA hydrolase/transferase C-terminal domain-containing protein [Propionibacteriaceae bacterium]
MRLISPAQLPGLLDRLPAEPRVVTQGSFGTPHRLLELIDAQLERYRLFVVNELPGLPHRDGVRHETIFVGPGLRGHQFDYYPCRLSLMPRLFCGPLAPDLVAVQVSRPVGGKVSLGIEVQVLPGALAAAKARGALIVAQLNHAMPFVHGDGVLDPDDFDAVLELDQEIPTAPRIHVDEAAAEIGARVAAMVPDGAALQAGIGAVPDAVLSALVGHRGMRVWTELLSEGFRQLHLAGSLDGSQPVIGSFAFGPPEFYEWIDDNPQVRLLSCEHTNSPAVIAAQPQMTSINTALQVDLFGAANASRINHRIFSGTGGQTDFFVGAMHASGGQAVMALKSWHPKANVSTIVPKLGEPTTSLQFSSVVTEHGTATVWGASQRDQALGIIEAADPRARGDLYAAAEGFGLIG